MNVRPVLRSGEAALCVRYWNSFVSGHAGRPPFTKSTDRAAADQPGDCAL